MTLLILGLVVWTIFHSIPAMGVGIRRRLVGKLGEKAYGGIAALMILASVVIMVFGWRSTIPEPVYFPPGYLEPVTFVLMFLSLLLFIASGRAARIKQFIRHPQLTGVVLWSVAHLLQAGYDRSIMLFGWLAVWAVLEMIFINRRDGVWVKEAAPALAEDIKLVVVTLVFYTVVLFAHPYLSGVDLI